MYVCMCTLASIHINCTLLLPVLAVHSLSSSSSSSSNGGVVTEVSYSTVREKNVTNNTILVFCIIGLTTSPRGATGGSSCGTSGRCLWGLGHRSISSIIVGIYIGW